MAKEDIQKDKAETLQQSGESCPQMIPETVYDIFKQEAEKNIESKDISTDSKLFNSNDDDKNLENSIIKNSNHYFLLKILSPQVTFNENKRRKHKTELIKVVKSFLRIQFLILFFLVFGSLGIIFAFHAFHNDLDTSVIKLVFNFISLYITSVVVELIALLQYIVRNVFDTSITGLVGLYKDTLNEKDTEKETEGKL